MKISMLLATIILGVMPTFSSQAADALELTPVTDDIYAIVGSLENRTKENLGNNATFGFVVTSEGVVLIDSGGTYKGAMKIHEVIKRVTDKPVVAVINTGGQDHRWLGNGYFKNRGAKLIASKQAVEDQKARNRDQFFILGNLVGVQGLEGTDPVYADTLFDKDMRFTVGEVVFEVHHAGPAHTPGDSFVWLPQQKVMFAGDIVFTERMLGILEYSNSKSWLNAYQAMASYEPKYLIPGHGHPCDLNKANADTRDYLLFLRQAVADFMENGGDISEIRKIDQSRFKYLVNFDLLAGRNAQKVYSELEWE